MSLGWHKQRAAERRAFARPAQSKPAPETSTQLVAKLERRLSEPLLGRSLRRQLTKELAAARARVTAVAAAVEPFEELKGFPCS